MRIAFLSRWNATCGVSFHAELVSKELMKRGHSVLVFAPDLESAGRWWHHKVIREDENYVKRVYREVSPQGEDGGLDLEEIIKEDFDLLLVESYEKLPYKDVEILIKRLKEKGVPAIAVIHEGLKEEVGYNLNLFDRVVVFDFRFVKEVVSSIDPEKVVEIPYPCIPPVKRTRKFAEDSRIIFTSFGRQPIEEYEDFIEVLERIREKYPNIIYRIVRSGEPISIAKEWITQERRILDLEDIYRLLGSADIHLLPKGNTKRVVVSSTFCQTAGSLCPVVSRRSRFFETLEAESSTPIVLYKDRKDLEKKILMLIEDDRFRKKIVENMKRYAEENSVSRVVDRFESLFNSVLIEDIK